MLKRSHYLLFSILCINLTIWAQPSFSQSYLSSYISDYETLEVSLLTTGVGKEPENRFGHTALRLKNSQIDRVYNWGMFSFDEPFFVWRFFKGDLLYSLGDGSFIDHLQFTRYQGRRLWEDQLILTANQKQTLVKLIEQNLKPEHRKFIYQYWFKNCATIPRDLIDKALGGAIRRHYVSEVTDQTFRDYVHKHLAIIPFAVPSLEIIMNGNLDRPITAWEAMFLPENVRDYFLKLPAFNDQGEAITGQTLMGETKIWLDIPQDFSALIWDVMLMTAPMWLLAMMASLLFVLKRYLIFSKFLGAGLTVCGVLGSFFGTIMLVSWMISGHFDLWHNANLAMFWPVDFFYLSYGWKLTRSADISQKSHNVAIVLSITHAAALICIGFLSITGIIMQDVTLVLGWYGIPLLTLWGLGVKFAVNSKNTTLKSHS